ncbi:hypothetical protein OG719_21465 [Microbispora hainanensis]
MSSPDSTGEHDDLARVVVGGEQVPSRRVQGQVDGAGAQGRPLGQVLQGAAPPDA